MTSTPSPLIVPQGRAKQLHQLLIGGEGHLIQQFLKVQTAKARTKDVLVLAILDEQEALLLSLMQVYLQEIIDQSALDPSLWIYPIREHHVDLWKVFLARPTSQIFRHIDGLKQQAHS
ncbi:hypothetical protein [Deinococcus cellulosilyticus]|uniref:Uncharacterized protein n=1 Tax=Deinococcus cellulosilyticus (strain DSM 18568 / NBRC 106333 / KACC 11606 / 5516J-15) TaxID=1223518 RepID=A0A511NBN6_DEIC1|nr:hypothetical protein [Deinococcus cellulosilyticus]GEM49781.1 hypothetical protein DC3_54160 [Deinococcus cellulosilyticus NBRC 106333 = KACC 11606]